MKPLRSLSSDDWAQSINAYFNQGSDPQSLFEQRVEVDCDVELDVLNASALSSRLQVRVIADRYWEHATTAFDLAQAPLVRLSVIKLGSDEFVLVVGIPHYAVDAIALQVCCDELLDRYSEHRSTLAGDERCESAAGFHEFTRAQRDSFERGAFDESLRFWTSAYTEMPMSSGRRGEGSRARVRSGQHAAMVERRPLSVEESTSIRDTLRKRRLPASVVFMSAAAELLRLRNHRETVIFQVPFANRVRPGTERLVGDLVNSHRLTVSTECRSSIALLSHCRAVLLSALCHQELPVAFVWERMMKRRSDIEPDIIFNFAKTLRPDRGHELTTNEMVDGTSAASGASCLELRVVDEGQRVAFTLISQSGMMSRRELGEALDLYMTRLRILVGSDECVPQEMDAEH